MFAVPKEGELMSYQDFIMRQSFSPAEAAEILSVPVNTLRSWLRRVPKAFTPDRQAGEWRKLSADSILAIRVMQELMNGGLFIEEAALAVDRVIYMRELPDNHVEAIRVSLFGEGEVLALTFDSDGKILEQRLLRTTGFDQYMTNSFFNENASRASFLNLIPLKIDIQERINKYLKWSE
jgi:hypothetical protein